VRLALGARMVEAVAAAGGLTGAADIPRINLAQLLVDGEQVYVPKVGETIPAGSAAGSTGGSAGGSAGGPSGPIHLNSADAAALDVLPGVGPVLAQRIVNWRNQHGSFSSVDELAEIQGIGDKLLASLRPLVTVA